MGGVCVFIVFTTIIVITNCQLQFKSKAHNVMLDDKTIQADLVGERPQLIITAVGSGSQLKGPNATELLRKMTIQVSKLENVAKKLKNPSDGVVHRMERVLNQIEFLQDSTQSKIRNRRSNPSRRAPLSKERNTAVAAVIRDDEKQNIIVNGKRIVPNSKSHKGKSKSTKKPQKENFKAVKRDKRGTPTPRTAETKKNDKTNSGREQSQVQGHKSATNKKKKPTPKPEKNPLPSTQLSKKGVIKNKRFRSKNVPQQKSPSTTEKPEVVGTKGNPQSKQRQEPTMAEKSKLKANKKGKGPSSATEKPKEGKTNTTKKKGEKGKSKSNKNNIGRGPAISGLRKEDAKKYKLKPNDALALPKMDGGASVAVSAGKAASVAVSAGRRATLQARALKALATANQKKYLRRSNPESSRKDSHKMKKRQKTSRKYKRRENKLEKEKNWGSGSKIDKERLRKSRKHRNTKHRRGASVAASAGNGSASVSVAVTKDKSKDKSKDKPNKS